MKGKNVFKLVMFSVLVLLGLALGFSAVAIFAQTAKAELTGTVEAVTPQAVWFAIVMAAIVSIFNLFVLFNCRLNGINTFNSFKSDFFFLFATISTLLTLMMLLFDTKLDRHGIFSMLIFTASALFTAASTVSFGIIGFMLIQTGSTAKEIVKAKQVAETLRLTDQEELARIALHDQEPRVRNAAISQLTGEKDLLQVIIHEYFQTENYCLAAQRLKEIGISDHGAVQAYINKLTEELESVSRFGSADKLKALYTVFGSDHGLKFRTVDLKRHTDEETDHTDYESDWGNLHADYAKHDDVITHADFKAEATSDHPGK